MATQTGVQGAPIAGSNLRHVNLVSKRVIQVQGDGEAEWFERTRDTYLDQLKLTEVTDLQDLDRLLVMELMVYRWTVHVTSGQDYEGDLVDEDQLQKQIKSYSDQISKLKAQMSLTKAQRDAEANEGSLAAYIANLKARAKAFGINRERELRKALALTHELIAITEAFDRSDEEERRKIGFQSEAEILAWVRDVYIPEFRAIDEYFRDHEQRFWIRSI